MPGRRGPRAPYREHALVCAHLRAHATGGRQGPWGFDTPNAAVKSVLDHSVSGGVMDDAGLTVAIGMIYVHSVYAGRRTANPNDHSGRDGNVLSALSVDKK